MYPASARVGAIKTDPAHVLKENDPSLLHCEITIESFPPVTMSDTLPEMQYRSLGRTGLKVSVISLGSWLTYGGHVGNGTAKSSIHSAAPDKLLETAFDCMKAAYDAGVNFFDTAEVYSGGQSEVVLGEAIKKFGWKQNDLVISTKVSLSSDTA